MNCPTCGSHNLPNAAFCSQCASRLLQGGDAPAMYRYASRGTTVLVLGILSIMVCSIMGPIAWSMGGEELRRIAAGETSPMGQQSAFAGRICGIVATVMLALTGLFVLWAVATIH